MGTLTRALRASKVGAIPLRDPALATWFGGRGTASGATVTEQSALNFLAVSSCVFLISDMIGMLPLPLYRRLSRGKERAVDHRLYEILHDQPNAEMDAVTFRSTVQSHLLTWGNGYAEIEWSNGGEVKALWPLRPDRTKVVRHERTRELFYLTRIRQNGREEEVPLAADRVMHLSGLGFDGLVGYSPITIARESIGLGLAGEEYAARFFGNNATPSGVLKMPKPLSDEAYKRLQKEFRETHEGLSNAQRWAILEEGLEWQSIGIPQKDAQFLEGRKFQRGEIAGFYRVPPHMIGDVDKATSWGTGIEVQSIGFTTYTLLHWTTRWQQGIRRKLLTASERRSYFAEFIFDGLLRGDTKARYEAYQMGVNNGWLSPNEVRERENLNPREGGDDFLTPLNMRPSSEPPPDDTDPKKTEPPPDDDDPDGEDENARSRRGDADVRCTQCGRMLARQLARPWAIDCSRCKTPNKSPLDSRAA